MAQTIEYWQQIIIDQLASGNIAVSGSRTSVRRMWTYAVAFCIWSLDVLFSLHQQEVSASLAEKMPHRERWYRNKALDFQYGYDLVTDSDKYDNIGLSDEQILISKIIKYAAVREATTESRLIIKVATETDGKLQPITLPQRSAFAAYIAEIKDAGVSVSIISYLPDRLYITMVIYYDPLVLDAQGNSIVDGGKPVEIAIESYMRELPFNGELVLAHLTDKLQLVKGVAIPDIKNAETSWISATSGAYGEIQAIQVKKIPESGYFEVVNYNNITYVPNA
ncbi:hypothetical protein [Pedobacter sp. WC2423]|uniref:hypothetical protein n=1 Tax=Pedobacter sp. WC2423 TaxID=3234142 RepID=UPI0034650B5A